MPYLERRLCAATKILHAQLTPSTAQNKNRAKMFLNTCVWKSLWHVRLFVTPWTAARQASLSFTISHSLLRLMAIESVMPSNHLILCCPLLLLPSIFPRIKVFSTESALFASGGQSTGASASASSLPMNIQGWFPLGLTGLISLQSKRPQESSPAPQWHVYKLWLDSASMQG